MGNKPSAPTPPKSIEESFKDFANEINNGVTRQLPDVLRRELLSPIENEFNKIPEKLKNEILYPLVNKINDVPEQLKRDILQPIIQNTNVISNQINNLETNLKNAIVSPLLREIDSSKTAINQSINKIDNVINKITDLPSILQTQIGDKLIQEIQPLTDVARAIESNSILSITKIDDAVSKITDLPNILQQQIGNRIVEQTDRFGNILLQELKPLTDVAKTIELNSITAINMINDIPDIITKAFDPMIDGLALATNTLKTIPSYIDDGNKLLNKNIKILETILQDNMKLVEDKILLGVKLTEDNFNKFALPVLTQVGDIMKMLVEKGMDIASLPAKLMKLLGEFLNDPTMMIALAGIATIVLIKD